METFIDVLKSIGVILGGVSSIYKSYKEVVKPFLDKRRKNKRKKI